MTSQCTDLHMIPTHGAGDVSRAARMLLKIVRDRYEGEAVQLGSRLILVRPDHYVAWCGDGAASAQKVVTRSVGFFEKPKTNQTKPDKE